MTNPSVIAAPIAMNHTNCVSPTMPWHVQDTEYSPETGTFEPLVNGEEAFGAVYDAIANAQSTIDIVCWGFQPSMRFKRGAGGKGSLAIGGLLAKMGDMGRRIRLLCWQDDLHIAEMSENMAPGNNFLSIAKRMLPDGFYDLPIVSDYMSAEYQTSAELIYDLVWYYRANYTDVTRQSLRRKVVDNIGGKGIFAADYFAAHWAGIGKPLKGLEFATRDFSMKQREEIAYRTNLHNAAVKNGLASGAVGKVAMEMEPTHHQKMVLIDYEIPERAVGFVMGHNMLDTYWDTSKHGYKRQKPADGRNGLHPRQDMSSRVRGPILKWLNKNFCEAWDDATGQKLTQARAGADAKLILPPDCENQVMAQIVRTQSQKGKFDIKKMYLQSANNATQFIYIENQYFRWAELANKIKDAAAKQIAGGRNVGQHGALHLFVITNSNDEGIGHGTVNTYLMLDALGRSDQIPAVASLEKLDALKPQLEEAQRHVIPEKQMISVAPEQALGLMQYQQNAQMDLQMVQQKIEESRHPAAVSIPGLKMHLCTLVAPDSPPGKWDYVYVHAKLMIVDDAFMTLGSANINFRSMNVDSEMNIFHENSAVTSALRKKLWTIHTGSNKGQDDPGAAFDTWDYILKKNASLQNSKAAPPIASIVPFQYLANKRTTDD